MFYYVASLIFFTAVSAGYSLQNPAFAAGQKMYFAAPKEVPAGAEFKVSILADSDMPVNAFSGKIGASPELEIVDFGLSGSIINIWQTRPLLENGAVKFNGGSISPFTGEKGKLFDLKLKAPKEGKFKLSFLEAEFFAADGKGTKILPGRTNVEIVVVNPEKSTSVLEEYAWNEPATDLKIESFSLLRDPFDEAQKILGLAVSGGRPPVKVEARMRLFFAWGAWVPVENLTGVRGDPWTVALRASDAAGLTAEKEIYDWKAFLVKVSKLLAVILIIGIMVYVFPARTPRP